MENKLNLYKDISIDILKYLRENKAELLSELIEKRQVLINEIENINEFKKLYLKELYIIDKQIQSEFYEEIDNIKKEIKEYKISQKANNSYINFNKEKINIFNKKV